MGNRKIVCLPNQLALRPVANMAKTPMKKSQFDVWGATIRTNLGHAGSVPSTRHPTRPSSRRANTWENGLPRRG